MNILVTGGTGFTGSALVMRLSELGHNVTSVDYKKGICFGELEEKGVQLITGSITDAALSRMQCGGSNLFSIWPPPSVGQTSPIGTAPM